MSSQKLLVQIGLWIGIFLAGPCMKITLLWREELDMCLQHAGSGDIACHLGAVFWLSFVQVLHDPLPRWEISFGKWIQACGVTKQSRVRIRLSVVLDHILSSNFWYVSLNSFWKSSSAYVHVLSWFLQDVRKREPHIYEMGICPKELGTAC